MPPGFCCRCRHGCIGRNPKPVNILALPKCEGMLPSPSEDGPPIHVDLAELEALRLVELEKLSYDEAGVSMGVSRNTIWRLVEGGKEKIITAFLEARRIEFHKR